VASDDEEDDVTSPRELLVRVTDYLTAANKNRLKNGITEKKGQHVTSPETSREARYCLGAAFFGNTTLRIFTVFHMASGLEEVLAVEAGR
jgi:hypothetical protein